MPRGRSRRLRLPPTRECGSATRAALRRLLDEAGVEPAARETAVLLATELVSNAVQHGGGSSFLDATVGAGSIRIEVADDNPTMRGLEVAPAAAAGLSERGRGLKLVAALSSRWGAERRDHGKTVWCEIPRS